jgi:hypothetical protein
MLWWFATQLDLCFILIFYFICSIYLFSFLNAFNYVLIIYIFQMHVDFLLVKQWGFKFLKTSSITKWFLLQVNSNLRAWLIRMHSVSKLSYLTFSIKRLIVIFTFNIKFILFLIFENIFIFLIFFTLQKLIL